MKTQRSNVENSANLGEEMKANKWGSQDFGVFLVHP